MCCKCKAEVFIQVDYTSLNTINKLEIICLQIVVKPTFFFRVVIKLNKHGIQDSEGQQEKNISIVSFSTFVGF